MLGEKQVYIVFDLDKKVFTGNTGCNNMRGTFQVKGSSLIFNPQIITTRMACGNYDEATFLQKLQQTNRFTIKNGILILYHEKTELFRWTRYLKKIKKTDTV